MALHLAGDLSFGLRTLRRSPGFTCVAILTLALGISANIALYSVVRAVLFRSLGYTEPTRIVQINGIDKAGSSIAVSIPDLLAFQSRARSFERIGTYRMQTFTLIGPREPQNIYGQMVSADLFPALGATPALGRGFAAADFQVGAPSVVLIAYSLWQSGFDGDPSIIGRHVTLNGSGSIVIGVMRPEFEFPLPAFRIWAPWQFTAGDLSNRSLQSYTLIGRLRPGIKPEAARAELAALSQSLAVEFPATNRGWRPVTEPINERIYGGIRPMLLTLLGAVGFVLLIACINVSNLLMARGIERSREMAVRAALGASRGRLIRQLLTESLLIAFASGILAVFLLRAWLRLLLSLVSGRTFSILPGAETASLDLRILAVSVLATFLTGILFGVLPAMRLSANLEEPLKEGARANTGGLRRRCFFTALVVLETALSVTLLTGAGLLLRSFRERIHVPLGFRPEQVLTVQIPSEWRGLTQPNDPASVARSKHYFAEIVSRLQSVPGVTAAAITTVLPLGSVHINTRIFIQGRPAPPPSEQIRIAYRGVTPDYFRVMGIPILHGRAFTAEDREDAPKVVMVSESAAHRFWPNEDAIGKQIALNNAASGPWYTVVGIAAGVRWSSLTTEPGPELYTCFQQVLLAPQVSTVVIRSARDPAELAGDARIAIRAINGNQPLAEIRTMSRVVSDSIAQSSLYTTLLACFAGLALLLAAAGIFSVIAWTVSQSTHEIGIRMALGASSGHILRTAMARPLAGAAIGAAIGQGGAALLTRLLQGQLFGVTATDPLTFGLMPVVLLAVAWFAAWIPARRAARIDPMLALRNE
jgi:putative ABC transport system permease protein